MADVVNNLSIGLNGVRVAAVTFTARPKLIFGFEMYNDRASLVAAIRNLTYDEGSGTNVAGALQFLRENVYGSTRDRLFVRDIAIAITDGFSNIRSRDVAEEARLARNLGYRIFAIGVGAAGDNRFRLQLESIGSDPPSDHVFPLSDVSNLEKIEDTLVRRTCREAPPSM